MGTTKKTTKKVTTGAKTARTSAPMDARVKAETTPTKAAVVAATTPAKSAPVAKTEAKPAPVAKVEVTAPVAVVDAPPAKLVAKHEVDALVREAAFLLAKRRNFRNGTPTQDWLAAEVFVNERLTARGYTVSA